METGIVVFDDHNDDSDDDDDGGEEGDKVFSPSNLRPGVVHPAEIVVFAPKLTDSIQTRSWSLKSR